MNDLSRYERFMQHFLPAQRGLCAYLRTLIANREDAEDVFQAAAAVMWEKFDSFQPDTKFEYWAYHITRLQALRFLKEKKRSRLVFSDDVLAMLADQAVAISNSTSDTVDTLQLCLKHLSEQDRELLRLRFESGATNRSVANTIGRPERTVSRMLSQLYNNLLRCIQQRVVGKKQGEQQ
jgi:RNA polymerase sigma-70 factor (ECF subfamily)